METVTISDLFQLITLGIILVAMFLIHKSVPVKQVDELISVAKGLADKTPTDLDNRILEIAEMLRGQLLPPNTVTVTDMETGVTTTHDVTLSVGLSTPSVGNTITAPTLESIANEAYAPDTTLGTNMTEQWLDNIQAEQSKS